MGTLVKSATWKSINSGDIGFTGQGHMVGAVDPYVPSGSNDDMANAGGFGAFGSMSRPEGSTIWSYTVPTNTKVICDRLVIIVQPGGFWNISTANPFNEASTPRCTAFVNVDGTAVAEYKIWAKGNQWLTTSDPSTGHTGPGNTITIGQHCEDNIAIYGDGILLTNGQILTVTINPESVANPSLSGGIFPTVLRINPFGMDTATGRFVALDSSYRIIDPVAGQTAYTYTVPANGLTLLGMAISADGGLPCVLGRGMIFLNGFLIHEMGYLNTSKAKSVLPTINIPLGFTIHPGDTIEIKGAPMVDTGGSISISLIGDLAPAGDALILAGLTRTPRSGRMQKIKQSTAAHVQVFMVSSTTGGGLTGLSGSLTINSSKNGAAGATITPTVTERATLGDGWYDLAFTSGMTDTLGPMPLHITAPGALPNDEVILEIVAYDPADAVHLGLSSLPNASAGANTGLPVVGSQIPNANSGTASGLPLESDITDVSTKLGTPAGASVSADIAAVKADTGSTVTASAAILSDTADLRKAAYGRWRIFNNQLFLYDTDDTTVIQTFDLKDDVGAPSQTAIFERVPI